VLSLAAVAAIWSRLYPGLLHYPVAWLDRSPPSLFWGDGISSCKARCQQEPWNVSQCHPVLIPALMACIPVLR
jgi:hypothetical protein